MRHQSGCLAQIDKNLFKNVSKTFGAILQKSKECFCQPHKKFGEKSYECGRLQRNSEVKLCIFFPNASRSSEYFKALS